MEPLGLGAMEMLLIFETTSSVIAEVAPFLYLSGSYRGRPEIRSLAVILLYVQTDKGSGNQNLLPLYTALNSSVIRRNQRSGSMFPLGSICASVHPDAQIKVQ